MEKIARVLFWSLATITSLVILTSFSMYLYEAVVDPHVTDLTIIKPARNLLALGLVGVAWSFVSGLIFLALKGSKKKGS